MQTNRLAPRTTFTVGDRVAMDLQPSQGLGTVVASGPESALVEWDNFPGTETVSHYILIAA